MLLFMLFLFPLALTTYFLITKEKKYFLVVFIGFMLSLIVCGLRFIFSYSHRLVSSSFIQNYFYYFGRLTLLPIILLVLLMLVISKDTWEYKISSFLPLMLSYYTLSLPYYIMSMTDSRFSGYDLFFKPLVYLLMIVQASYLIKKFYTGFNNFDTKAKVINISVSVFYLLLPAFCDTCFAINKLVFLAVLFFLAGTVYCLYCYFGDKKIINLN